MSRFHNYSFGNILEIARQRPTATRVAEPVSMEPAWTEGEERRERDSDSRPNRRHQAQERRGSQQGHYQAEHPAFLVGFRNAYVFDVEQTEGAELPTLREMTGTVGENRDRLISFIEAQGHRAFLHR